MLSFALSSTFALTSIYSKFMFNDQQLQINKAKIEEVENKHDDEIRELRSTMYRKINEVVEDVNGRIDRKSERITGITNSNNEEIEELQKQMLIIKTELKK